MTRDISLYVSDIIDNMNKAESFIEGMTYTDFIGDEKTLYAVVRCIEIIGEASKNIPLGLSEVS
jgi:uncharacterized protein with HEPN domain